MGDIHPSTVLIGALLIAFAVPAGIAVWGLWLWVRHPSRRLRRAVYHVRLEDDRLLDLQDPDKAATSTGRYAPLSGELRRPEVGEGGQHHGLLLNDGLRVSPVRRKQRHRQHLGQVPTCRLRVLRKPWRARNLSWSGWEMPTLISPAARTQPVR